jgi:diguanylate cyclase (GGDEF)-like protein/PAS domain S-box-containing protein
MDLQTFERLALAALCTQEGIWDWDLRTDAFFASLRWQEMLGRAGETPAAHRDDWLATIHPKDRARLERDLDALLRSTATRFEHEHRVRHAQGDVRWMGVRAVVVRDAQGRAERVVGVQTDISDRKQFEALARNDSLYDPLTRLATRRLFDRRLSRALERARRHADYHFALLFVDLDHFKQINDGLGHVAGDCVLAETARRLQACLRPGDMVARRGGDEFTVLVDDLDDLADALGVADRIQLQVGAPIELDGQCVSVSASVGIAASSRGYALAAEMLRDADQAMYRAKHAGKSGKVVHSFAIACTDIP